MSRLGLRIKKVRRGLSGWRLARALLLRRVAPSVEHDEIEIRGFRSIIDVGANRGQFALWALARAPDVMVEAFEPGTAAYEDLVWVLRPYENRARAHRLAASDQLGEARLNVARGSDNSSLLRPTERQLSLAPESVVRSVETVRTMRLDSFQGLRKLERPTLLKIDVQGTEDSVLRGAQGLLSSIDAVLVELTFVPMYEEGDSGPAVVGLLVAGGFRLSAIFNPLVLGRRIVQCDALFAREVT